MKFEIKSRWTGEVLFSVESDSWRFAVEAAVKSGANLGGASLEGANLRSANLRSANLRSADLEGADLEGADLEGADLRSADLEGADLEGADLEGADLSGANLEGANLRSANLSGADLEGADLRSANLSGAELEGADLRSANLSGAKNLRLPTGETIEEYLAQTVPALLIAGGKKLEEVANEKNWQCHSWENCPMAIAFNVHRLEDVPILFRPRAQQFVQLFDAQQIPLSAVLKATP